LATASIPRAGLREAMTFVPKRTIAPKLYANLSLLATGAALRFFLGNLHGAEIPPLSGTCPHSG
jgi:hypothetical protein